MNLRMALMIPFLMLLSGCGDDDSVASAADHTSYLPDSRPLAPTGSQAPTPAVRSPIAAGSSYSGRVVYRGTGTGVAGVLVEAVDAKDDGTPTDDALGSARADAAGHFTVKLTEQTDKRVALVVSAVRSSAETGGDRREEGYKIRNHQIQLGFHSNPSPAKANIISIERRRPQHQSEDN